MARKKSATTQNPKRLRGLTGAGYINTFEYLPQMEAVHPRNGYGLRAPWEYRHHWRRFHKNSKPKGKK